MSPSTPSQPYKTVPVLITWDIDPDSWVSAEKRQWALNVAIDLCHSLDIRATFFFTAQGADIYPDEFRKMLAQGHEIGCHGLTHDNEENYDRMPEDMQHAYIQQATEKLGALAGRPMRAFRSPRVKTCAYTLRQLVRYGYWVDSSVCSQRMDLISSNLINVGWLLAPRSTYHPHRDSAFKSGDLPIWEVPVSAILAPFISSMLRSFGLGVMKALFRLLYAESHRTGKPIVYLAHPVEFTKPKPRQEEKGKRKIPFLTRKHLSPAFVRTHGFLFIRALLYRMDGETQIAMTQELFTYMASFPDVTFMTASEYAIHCLGVTPESS
jgi:peptidoglycan/xylan/chitin deacetylase (PgdA/CDA1 family)